MTTYEPNKWVIIKFDTDEGPAHVVFGSWSGGYLDGDSWRRNSGIVRVEEDGDFLLFHGHTGSVYRVFKDRYGVAGGSNYAVLDAMVKASESVNAQVLPEDTDWLNLEGISVH